MKKVNEKKALLKYIKNDDDFKKINNNKYLMEDFIEYIYENKFMRYLSKKYLDISYIVINEKIIDLDNLYSEYKGYIIDCIF